jgi:outer membrane protein TolC
MSAARRLLSFSLFAGCFSIAAAQWTTTVFADDSELSSSGPDLPRISLAKAIERATQLNPDNRIALEQIRRAEALITEARSNWLPSLSANGSYTRLDANRTLTGADGVQRILQPRDQFNGNLLVSVPLLAPQRWVQSKRASWEAESLRRDAVEVRREVALAAAHAYVDVMARQRVIEVNQRALENNRAHYDYAHTRFLGGIGNQLDDTRAAQEVASSEVTLQNSLVSLTMAQEQLGVLVGFDGPLDAEDSFVLPSVPPQELTRDAIDAPPRGDVLASRYRALVAKKLLKATWAEFAPQVNGTFTPFYSNPPSPTLPTTGWNMQILVTVPLIQGGMRVGLFHEREAALAQSRVQLEAVVRQAKADVRVAMSAVERADAALLAAGRAAELAHAALKMANIAYEAGATTNIEVIDAERRARDAETNAVIAEDVARRARIDLLSATGHLP